MTELGFKNGFRVFSERLKHQKQEVANAEKMVGCYGYSKAYLQRMRNNLKFTQTEFSNFKKKYAKQNDTDSFVYYRTNSNFSGFDLPF